MTVYKGAASEMVGGAELEDGPALDGPAAVSWVWGMCVVWFVPALDEGRYQVRHLIHICRHLLSTLV
jgi:hypothetical protein